MYHKKNLDLGQQNCEIYFFLQSSGKKKICQELLQIFMQFLLTSNWRYIAVTGVLCEFSYRHDVFITHVFT